MGKLATIKTFLIFGLVVILVLAGFVAWLVIGLIFLALWVVWQVIKGGTKGIKRLF